MEYRHLGRSGLAVSRLGLGTMTWGVDTDPDEAAEILAGFCDAGGTLVDTAAVYGDGKAEQILGELLGKTVPREDVVLATKAGISHRNGHNILDTSRRALLDTLDASLARLGTDHVDLWQVHVYSGATPAAEVMSALEQAVSSGRARYVGVSNYGGWQLAQAATLQLASPSGAQVISNQVEYSLLNRGVETEGLPAAHALGVGVLAWSPLGRGVLTGKYRSGTPVDSRAASTRFGGFVEGYLTPNSRSVVDAVATAATGLGCSPLEVALAWVRDHAGVTAAVVGARTSAQLKASLAAEAVTLPLEIRIALDDVSDPRRPQANLSVVE
ncbi:aldo/keto reductase [Sporichthya sp.]|uniref:aldo/keto reductase n=1 Tax=Sporichthya sp. TaxID=65475 RepID=UPI00182A803E|nr:aldo/keto reductase [Sporichthya sp.]